MNETTRERTRVCVVGAGAAGLCAARHLARDLNAFAFRVFEKSDDVGGTWVYTDRTGSDSNGMPIHSSMYKNMRTNLPKELMNFPDYPEIKGGNASCVSHEAILEYLKDYTNHFNLRRFIQFNTAVEYIKLETPSGETADAEKWRVKVKDVKSGDVQEHVFDAVMVCNGHYFDPYLAHIPGLSEFSGRVLHSHDYRRPEDFAGKRVILLGASSSGIDIALELIDVAERVYLSHNNSNVMTFRSAETDFTETRGIERFEAGKFVLTDGSSIDDANVLIFCTGYHFTYPFLDESCGIEVNRNYVAPLYKHLVNVEHPSMCLVGVPMIIVPFPMFHMQVQYFLAVLRGTAHLPSREAMLDDARLKTAKKRHAHRLAMTQWQYNDELAREGGFQPLAPFYSRGYQAWSALRRTDLRRYKSMKLVVAEDRTTAWVIDPAKEPAGSH